MARAATKKKPVEFAELKVEHWPVERLKAYAGNPRKNDHAVARMCDAIREFGFRMPIVAKSDGLICDGHLRLKAAIKLGIKTVPVALADNLSDAQIKAFRLLANQSASWAEWDVDLLRIELTDLKLEGYDLQLTGFEDVQLVSFLSGVNDVNGQWTGMPEFATGGNDWHRSIMVHFESEKDVQDFVKKLGVTITEDTKTVFLPKKKNIPLKAKQYEGVK